MHLRWLMVYLFALLEALAGGGAWAAVDGGGGGALAASTWVDPSPHRSGFVRVNGVKLHYLDWGGKGPPLLFLAGHGSSAHIFDDFAPLFTDRFRVLGLTRRGHGESDKPPTGYDLETRVEDIRQFLDQMKIGRVSLIGHSLAGDELTHFAGRYPKRVNKLVYLDAAIDRGAFIAATDQNPPPVTLPELDRSSLETFRQAWLKTFRFWSDAMEADIRATNTIRPDGSMTAVLPPEVRLAIRAASGQFHPNYSRVKAPALALYTPFLFNFLTRMGLDPESLAKMTHYFETVRVPVRRRSVEQFRTEVARGKVVEIPGADHYLFITHQGRTFKEMWQFLLQR